MKLFTSVKHKKKSSLEMMVELKEEQSIHPLDSEFTFMDCSWKVLDGTNKANI